MFNLIVSGHVGDSGTAQLTFDKSRFLEYTNDVISKQLATLSVEAMASLRSWPCLVMQEGRNNETAFLAQIYAIESKGSEGVWISTKEIVCPQPINNKALWQIRNELDIDEFEFHRNHWSIKERDLVQILTAAGYEPDSSELTRIRTQTLPAPGREVLIQAKARVAEWAHTTIDDFLIEAGVAGLDASRSLGSRRDRANAILQFILGNSGAVTADNHLFSAFFVRKAGVTGSISAERATTLQVADVEPAPASAMDSPASRSPNRVFIVHGRNEEARNKVVALLNRVGLEAIVLHEQPNMGRHLLTKFIEEAELVTFAVVVMTDDDLGGPREGGLKPRARQNVILELGYFLSHLGQKRVCAIISPDLETPSDFDGIVYIRMGANDMWERELIRELRAAEMPLHLTGS